MNSRKPSSCRIYSVFVYIDSSSIDRNKVWIQYFIISTRVGIFITQEGISWGFISIEERLVLRVVSLGAIEYRVHIAHLPVIDRTVGRWGEVVIVSFVSAVKFWKMNIEHISSTLSLQIRPASSFQFTNIGHASLQFKRRKCSHQMQAPVLVWR